MKRINRTGLRDLGFIGPLSTYCIKLHRKPKKVFNTKATASIYMHANTEDYVFAICLTWMIMVCFFIVITREIFLLIGVVFPILIMLLERGKHKNNYSRVM